MQAKKVIFYVVEILLFLGFVGAVVYTVLTKDYNGVWIAGLLLFIFGEVGVTAMNRKLKKAKKEEKELSKTNTWYEVEIRCDGDVWEKCRIEFYESGFDLNNGAEFIRIPWSDISSYDVKFSQTAFTVKDRSFERIELRGDVGFDLVKAVFMIHAEGQTDETVDEASDGGLNAEESIEPAVSVDQAADETGIDGSDEIE